MTNQHQLNHGNWASNKIRCSVHIQQYGSALRPKEIELEAEDMIGGKNYH